MELSEAAQEVLELLWTGGEGAETGGLPVDEGHEAGTSELVRLGLATTSGATLSLTARGRPEAAKAVRRHRLAERLVADVLATGNDQMEAHACRLEHALVEGLDESICTLLGHPRFCPHGRPIPAGKCCEQHRSTVTPLVAPLSSLKAGQEGYIAYIQAGAANHTQKLMAMGVLPGVQVRLVQRSPSFVFEAGFSQFAVDEEIAGDIYVRTKA